MEPWTWVSRLSHMASTIALNATLWRTLIVPYVACLGWMTSAAPLSVCSDRDRKLECAPRTARA